jgi:hypothetical protein
MKLRIDFNLNRGSMSVLASVDARTTEHSLEYAINDDLVIQRLLDYLAPENIEAVLQIDDRRPLTREEAGLSGST